MKVRTFEGGLATRLDANLIGTNEAVEYINIDNDTAVLKPVPDKVPYKSDALRFAYFSDLDLLWRYSDTPVDYVEYQERLYFTDRVGRPKKVIDNVAYDLGIAAPTGSYTVTPVNGPRAVERITLNGIFRGGADLPSDTTLKYKVVNKSSTTGYISHSYYEVPLSEAELRPEDILSRQELFDNATFRAKGFIRPRGEPSAWNLAFERALDNASGFNAVELVFPDTNADLVRPYRFFDGAWRALTPDFISSVGTFEDTTLDISANELLVENSLVSGIIQYAITFYSSVTGFESAPLLSEEVEVANGTLVLTDLPESDDPQVDSKRIYRIGANLTQFTLVDTIPDSNTSYADTIIDDDVEGTLLNSQDNTVAPEGLKFLTEAYAMFFGALGDKLRFTPIGNPEAWPETFFLDFPEPLTGISKTPIGLLIHTKFKTYLVTGTGPTSFAQQILANDQGCLTHDSIQETKDTAVWVSTDGICISDGSDVQVASRNKLGKLALEVTNSVLYDQVYLAHLTDGTTLALDFERAIFKRFDYGVDALAVGQDRLYGTNGGTLFELEAATTPTTLTYRSPDFSANGLVNAKTYSAVRFYHEGDTTLEVFIDGESVASYQATGTGTAKVKIPKQAQRGFYISFQFVGTGTVRELDWMEDTANG